MNSTIQLKFITRYLEDGTQRNKDRLQVSNQGQFGNVVCVPDHWSNRTLLQALFSFQTWFNYALAADRYLKNMHFYLGNTLMEIVLILRLVM